DEARVGREGGGEDLAPALLPELPELGARGRVPQPRGPVVARREDEGPVPRERGGGGPARVPFEPAEGRARRRVPGPDPSPGTRRQHLPPIGGERRGGDDAFGLLELDQQVRPPLGPGGLGAGGLRVDDEGRAARGGDEGGGTEGHGGRIRGRGSLRARSTAWGGGGGGGRGRPPTGGRGGGGSGA